MHQISLLNIQILPIDMIHSYKKMYLAIYFKYLVFFGELVLGLPFQCTLRLVHFMPKSAVHQTLELSANLLI